MTLKQTHILITRPAHQAQGLIQLLSSEGASILLFPTLVIHPVTDQTKLLTAIQESLQADWYIFISPNAVEHVMPLVVNESWLPLMRGRFASVGAGTRDCLAGYGVHDILYPADEVGSLALLDTLAKETMEGKTVVIFKGDSGNPTLEEGLAARNARVIPIPCYERHPASDDSTPLVHALENKHIDLIVTTSGDGLKSLVHLIPDPLKSSLYQLPLLVISERLKNLARETGFSTIVLAKDASDEAIVTAVHAWHHQGATHD